MRTIQFNYRVVVDMIGKRIAKVTADSTDEVVSAVEYLIRTKEAFTKSPQGFGYVKLEDAVEFELGRQHYKVPNPGKMQYKLLRNSRSVHFIAYQYKEVRDEVYTALGGENNVYVHSPYKKPFRTVEIKSMEQWAKLLVEEAASNRDYAINMERKNNIKYLLGERTQWLPGYATLEDLYKEFDDMPSFMEYAAAVIEGIEREGNWDTETPTTRSFVDGQGLYQGQVKEGKTKGQRQMVATDGNKTFDSYIVTDADLLTQFLSLTFYKAVGMKPMAKMVEKPVAPGYTELVAMNPEDEFTEEYFKTNSLRTTPLYVSQEEQLKCFCNKTLNQYSTRVTYELPEVR